MKNIWMTAIVVSLFAGAKVAYSYYTSVSQEEVIAYVNAVDKYVSPVDKEVSSVILDLSFSSSEEDGDRKIQTTLQKIKTAEDSIEKINVPKDDADFNAVKETALAQLKSDGAGVSNTLGKMILKLRAKEEPYKIDEMSMYFTGKITMKKSPLNDSLENIISGLRENLVNDKSEGMSKYNSAKDALYSKYKIINLTTFQ
jgi:hypothetical protein